MSISHWLLCFFLLLWRLRIIAKRRERLREREMERHILCADAERGLFYMKVPLSTPHGSTNHSTSYPKGRYRYTWVFLLSYEPKDVVGTPISTRLEPEVPNSRIKRIHLANQAIDLLNLISKSELFYRQDVIELVKVRSSSGELSPFMASCIAAPLMLQQSFLHSIDASSA